MFTLDDDFDVDEDFLSNAFQTTSKNNKSKIIRESSDNGQQIANNHFQNLRHLELPAVSNIEKCEEHIKSKNDKFLELWKANENNLFNAGSSQNKSDPRSKIDISRAISPRGFKTEVFTRTCKNVRSRKFPGPAGLLPERNINTSFIVPEEVISNLEKDCENLSEFEEQEVFSQTTNKLFEEPEGPWQKMISDLGQLGKHLISTINLSTLQGKQARNGFKVPFLAVFIQSIDCSLPDPSVILKDEKEEINGTLHRDVWEEWKEEIVIGSVLVLRNVGVISAGNSSRRYFLNITANNIITIYSPIQDCSIKVIKINSSSNMNTSLILEEWEKLIKQNKQLSSLASEGDHCRPLFSMFSGPQVHKSPLPPKPTPVRPQFSNNSKISPGSLRLGRSAMGILHDNSYTNKQNTVCNKFPFHQPSQSSNMQLCTPPNLSQEQKLSMNLKASSPLYKKPRTMESHNQQKIKSSGGDIQSPVVKSIFNLSDSSSSIVESVLDGIDTDSLFEDF